MGFLDDWLWLHRTMRRMQWEMCTRYILPGLLRVFFPWLNRQPSYLFNARLYLVLSPIAAIFGAASRGDGPSDSFATWVICQSIFYVFSLYFLILAIVYWRLYQQAARIGSTRR